MRVYELLDEIALFAQTNDVVCVSYDDEIDALNTLIELLEKYDLLAMLKEKRDQVIREKEEDF